MDKKLTIVLFKQDLRLEDNPALFYACERGKTLPVFIYDLNDTALVPGSASKYWLHYSLQSLSRKLDHKKSKLILLKGDTVSSILSFAKEVRADAVYWNRRVDPISQAMEASLHQALFKEGISSSTFKGDLLFEPWKILNKQNKPFQVFTPFWRACLDQPPVDLPLPEPSLLEMPSLSFFSEKLEDFDLLPKMDWAKGIRDFWQIPHSLPNEEWKQFLLSRLGQYEVLRDLPDADGTSRLSPSLHFGEVSVRRIWYDVKKIQEQHFNDESFQENSNTYLKELGWREFAHYLLYHFPKTLHQPMNKRFLSFPWQEESPHRIAWEKGQTGYPIVDAGMRQLWQTGWMHNRVRMIVASFLVKDLLISWREGARWFQETLVDADLANNTLGWQWSAGCGADAAPYFRIFNPILQGEKFDPEGKYVRTYVKELRFLPNKWIHKPFQAPQDILSKAKIQLGDDYPYPIVDHQQARDQALSAFHQLSK